MEKDSLLNNFIMKTKQILCEKFYQESNGIELKNVYPVIFDNVEYNKSNTFSSEIDLNDFLGKIFEQSIPLEIKKDLGQFYTRSSFIIDNMINNIDLLSGKILEPCCGSGLFIVKIIQKLIELLSKNNKNSFEIISYIISNIYGNDIDKTAIEIAELNALSALFNQIIISINLNNTFKIKRFHLFNKDFIEKELFEKFSIVIGNPPFITMYGKRSRNMTEEKRKIYNTFDFVQNKNGNNKFNISMFFIENGLKALNDTGELIFVLDISFFETAYIDLRKYILENYSIKYIGTGLKEFENVASGQLIINISKDKLDKKIIWHDFSTNKNYYIKQSDWLNDFSKYRFRKPLNEIEDSINLKIKRFRRLDYYFPNKSLRTCCALTGKTDEFIINPLLEKEILTFPYIEGAKGLSEKFGKLKTHRHIKYDYELQLKLSNKFKKELEAIGVKNKKRVTLGDKEVYLSPKIFIRQSSFELIATFTEKPFAANNSIYVLSNKNNDAESLKLLKFTCGILNSDLITFYSLINNIIRINEGKTPQIKISDLKDVRIPYDERKNDNIINIVEKLLDNPFSKNDLYILNEEIYSLFKITNEEVNYITNYLKQKKESN